VYTQSPIIRIIVITSSEIFLQHVDETGS